MKRTNYQSPCIYSCTPPEGTWVYHPDFLRSLSTIATGQADDLKLETGGLRYWTARCSAEDGEDWDVHVERLEDGRWVQLFSYREGDS